MPQVRSFDIFDTLLARRCIEPRNIFLEMEKLLSVPGFADARMGAEVLAATGPHGLKDIYAVLAQRAGAGADAIDQLMALECRLEIENAIAIRENIDLVENGDILVSDMYLPADIIRRMLDKVGLRKHVGLVVTNDGKASGKIWPQLQTLANIEQHFGDNPRSDHEMPMAAGIFSTLVQTSAVSPQEAHLRSAGFEHLARAVRELRLRVFSSSDSNEKQMQMLLQISCNIPLLVLCSVYVHLLATQLGTQKVLFSSRDCFYLQRIYMHLSEAGGHFLPSEYFYTSRVCRTAHSAAYIRYFQRISEGNALIADMCGTGWSLRHLMYDAAMTMPIFLLHDYSGSDCARQYESMLQSKRNVPIHSLIRRTDISCAISEVTNYIDCGMAVAVAGLEQNDAVIPFFEEPHFPENVRDVIRTISFVQDSFLDVLKNHDCGQLVAEIAGQFARIPAIAGDMHAVMAANINCMPEVIAYHQMQGGRTARILGAQVGGTETGGTVA